MLYCLTRSSFENIFALRAFYALSVPYTPPGQGDAPVVSCSVTVVSCSVIVVSCSVMVLSRQESCKLLPHKDLGDLNHANCERNAVRATAIRT